MLTFLVLFGLASAGPAGRTPSNPAGSLRATPQVSSSVTVPRAPRASRPQQEAPQARPNALLSCRPSALTWGQPYVLVPRVQPVVVEVVEPEPPRKTAWQEGPTKVENPGKPVAFEDLPSAFTPIEQLQ